MTRTIEQRVIELSDREAIRECLYRYSRAVDRRDEDMLRGVYWPDAIDSHLSFKGNVEELIAWAMPVMRTMAHQLHLIGNIIINLRGERADVESYFSSTVVLPGDPPRDRIGYGRYLDKFEKRGDEWRIIERIVMTDWYREFPDTADWGKSAIGVPDIARGRNGMDDTSYSFLTL